MNEVDIFDEVYNREFRWPTSDDQPFDQSKHPAENAEIEQRPHSRLYMMVSGYKLAADLMVERSTRDRFDRSALVYPIVFNYRHFVELSLKLLIATYGQTVGVKPNWKDHDLKLLWKSFVKVLDGYGHKDKDGTDPAVASIVAEFSKVDQGSFSFRYPVDQNGKKIPLDFEELDLRALADVMHGLQGYFTGCDGYLDNLRSAGP